MYLQVNRLAAIIPPHTSKTQSNTLARVLGQLVCSALKHFRYHRSTLGPPLPDQLELAG